ncbi:hypothetical protein PR002_g28483 [Phytophthora rubi]|uniref:MULE transposase domain-containing protein n=1 Tax=Phytophthora rubi TaxID=129364 RepID=A0A6A3HAV2_9STRA|nr:hypothetical protein PR002_g28483 [Phytophthora rubi]
MEADADVSGNDSDATVVLEYVEDSNVETNATISNEPSSSDENVTSTAVEAGSGRDSESSLDFGSDSGEVSQPSDFVPTSKPTYTSIGFFDSLSQAEQALRGFNSFVYTYQTRYLSPFVLGKVYQCRSHVGCGHRLKLSTHRGDGTTFRYQLLERGRHCGAKIQLPERGISLVLKPEIDALLKLGMAAGRVRNMLLFKYMREPQMLAHVPAVKKMENRKAYLKKKAAGGWEINKFVTLQNWAARKMCQDAETFRTADESNMADMNAMIILDEFEHTSTDGGKEIESMGIIVTTRALFSNVRQAVQDQGPDLVMSTDGTYRLHFGGWTLVDCGGISVETSSSGFVQRFRPWLYMFVRTECTYAYQRMFAALVKYASLFYGVDVSVRSASIDHSDAIASALAIVWPAVEVLTCWEHLLRQARKQTKLTNRKDFVKEFVQPHLRLLHASRSLRQFRALAKRIVAAWNAEGEQEIAKWLQTVYLTPRWERWSVGSSSVPGFLPTQQPIESHHRVIKVIVTDYKKAPTISILNSVLPRVLLYDATNLSAGPQAHYAEGPLPVDAVVKAKTFLIETQNHRIVNARASGRPARIFLTARRLWCNRGILPGLSCLLKEPKGFKSLCVAALEPQNRYKIFNSRFYHFIRSF